MMTNDMNSEMKEKDRCKDKKRRLDRLFCYFISAFGHYPIADDTCNEIYCHGNFLN